MKKHHREKIEGKIFCSKCKYCKADMSTGRFFCGSPKLDREVLTYDAVGYRVTEEKIDCFDVNARNDCQAFIQMR